MNNRDPRPLVAALCGFGAAAMGAATLAVWNQQRILAFALLGLAVVIALVIAWIRAHQVYAVDYWAHEDLDAEELRAFRQDLHDVHVAAVKHADDAEARLNATT